MDKQRFRELQKAFQAGYKKPEADLDQVKEKAFDKLSLHEAKQAVREGQERKKENITIRSRVDEKNSLVS